jgi:hypothetical protein
MTPYAVSAWTFITSHAKAEWERHRDRRRRMTKESTGESQATLEWSCAPAAISRRLTHRTCGHWVRMTDEGAMFSRRP